MPSNSYASSMDAQNGSAYGYGNLYSDSTSYLPNNHNPDAAVSHPAYAAQYSSNYTSDSSQPRYEHENTIAQSESYAYESHSQSAYAHQHRPLSHQQAGSQSALSAAHHSSERDYYLQPSPRYPTPEYEHVLAIEEEQLETSTTTTAYVPRPNSAHDHSVQQNERTRYPAPPPTTQWWTDEQSPEERMRVGLPRWENHEQQYQYEQPRRRRQRADRT